MDEVFNINFEGYKTDTDYISIVKVRLWPSILASIQWILKNKISGHNLIQSGVGLMIINNLAISVEGFIADMIVQQLDNNEFNKPKEIKFLEKATWSDKIELYNNAFEKKLDIYPEFRSIEALFILRNNFSHGRSHSEMTKTNILTGVRTNVESTNSNYKKARSYFTERGFLKESDVSSSDEILWKLQIVVFLFGEVKKFLFHTISDNNSPKFVGILSELNNAFSA